MKLRKSSTIFFYSINRVFGKMWNKLMLTWKPACGPDLPTVETSWVSAGKLHCTNYLIVQTALHAKPVQ